MAMDGHDVFNTFGFPSPKRRQRSKQTKKVSNYTHWYYDIATPDWVDDNTGLRLAKYTPPDELKALLASRENSDLE